METLHSHGAEVSQSENSVHLSPAIFVCLSVCLFFVALQPSLTSVSGTMQGQSNTKDSFAIQSVNQ